MPLFLLIFFCFASLFSTKIIGSGNQDSDMFIKKLRDVVNKGFPYLSDTRYTQSALKNMHIPDTITWQRAETFDYKYVVVPDVLCNEFERTMLILLISLKASLFAMNWKEFFLSTIQDNNFVLIVKINESVHDQAQEMIITLLESIPQKEKLLGLDCSECNLRNIDDFCQFSSLRYVRFEQNSIAKLPECFFQSLPVLRWLFCAKNQITELPEFSHDTLEVVDLRNNQLSALRFGVLPKLRRLNVIHNMGLGNTIIIDCLNKVPDIKKLTISDSGDYAFLSLIDQNNYQIKTTSKQIQIST